MKNTTTAKEVKLHGLRMILKAIDLVNGRLASAEVSVWKRIHVLVPPKHDDGPGLY